MRGLASIRCYAGIFREVYLMASVHKVLPGLVHLTLHRSAAALGQSLSSSQPDFGRAVQLVAATPTSGNKNCHYSNSLLSLCIVFYVKIRSCSQPVS